MMFIAIKTKDGVIKGKLSFYCRMLGVSRQGFYKYLAIKDRPWKYQDLADAMRVIHAEDECNDTYGRIRMYQALLLKNPTGIKIPSERTVYRVMDEIGLVHRPKRKPNGITKADREARKSDDLLKREFKADKPLEKCVTDITEIKAKDGKLYVSAIFDCFDSSVLGLAMETNMKATLCEHTLDNAYLAHPDLRGAIVHSDRGRQYTSETYRQALSKYGIIQSMNSDGGRCHDNARCESMWARMKRELLYDRYNTESLTTDELRVLIWRYFISYWNNRRICSANGGLPPMIKRQRYYQSGNDIFEINVSTNIDNITCNIFDKLVNSPKENYLLEQFARNMYRLKEYECYQIDDVIDYVYDYFKNKNRSISFSRPSIDNYKLYYASLKGILTRTFGTGMGFSGDLYFGDAPLSVLVLNVEHSTTKDLNVITNNDQLNEILLNLERSLVDNQQMVFVRRNLRIYQREKIFIVKPVQRKYWTYSAACRDADEIFEDISKAWR